MYAIIETGGKQVRIQKGDVIDVEKLVSDDDSNVTFSNVLAVADDNNDIKIGTPFVDGVTVEGELIDNTKAKKVVVFKMKRRKGYRRKSGHRQIYSKVRITNINSATGDAQESQSTDE